jgi:hypothetical protein
MERRYFGTSILGGGLSEKLAVTINRRTQRDSVASYC